MAGLLNRLAELTDEQLEEGMRTLSGIRTDIGQFYRAAMLMELDRRGKGIKGGPGSGDKPGHPFRGNQWDGGGGSRSSNLSEDENEAVDLWVTGLTGPLRDAAVDPANAPEEEVDLLNTLERALDKFPRYQGSVHGLVYRSITIRPGMEHLGGSLEEGQTFSMVSPASSSKEKTVADKWAKRESRPGHLNVLFELEQSSGADISSYNEVTKAQQEVVLKRGTVYKISSVRTVPVENRFGILNLTVIRAREVENEKANVFLLTKGDLPGHPFRGNQWTGGRSGGSAGDSSLGLDDALDVLTGKQPPNAATSVRKIDQTSIKSDSALGKGGINVTRIVEIEESDGTIGKYVFKPDDGENPGVHLAFRGHQSSNEVAASIIDEALGLDMVAKTEMVEIGGKKGSLQKWVNDDAQVADKLIEWDADDRVKDSSKVDNAEGVADMMYFDALIGNHDRHINNWLVKDGKVKLIDNGMSMADNMEYGDISFRTMEHAGRKMAMTRMSPKFKDALNKMIANKEQTDAKLREAGIGAIQRQSFWKRAEYIRKSGMLGFGESLLRDLGRLAEGRQLF